MVRKSKYLRRVSGSILFIFISMAVAQILLHAVPENVMLSYSLAGHSVPDTN